ncbi:transmembrane protein C1orf162 homolog [Myiozetetes cayanensis]|uniref:transmembrane protein C1orf162 homolog n=1 Tax=Myiozetetes cayanensis TaxID=478635 RepID=UPI00215DFFA1|nr:transmembrane protein C1orf162 homolog [Myiozetetes cayanensis]XP_050182688.1 transmembrane protein C1orf162 homolog [Myiozetetes cayanensis]
MGGRSSKLAVPVTPPSTTPTTTTHFYVPTTVPTTIHTTVHTELEASQVKCLFESHEILYMSLAFISGILLTLLVYAIICLFRKNYKKSHQHLQEQVSFQAAPEEYARNTQNEVTYSTLVFQRSQTPLAV